MNSQENYLHQLVDKLRTQLLIMGVKTHKALEDAVRAIKQRDPDIARMVREGDEAIDTLENEIDEASLNILIRSQPVAKDLRIIMTAVRMVLDLERIGDEAVNIADQVTLMKDMNVTSVDTELTMLGQRSIKMLDDALQAFKDGNSELALEVSRYDVETAEIMAKVYHNIMDQVQSGAMTPWASMHIIFIIRSLDRIFRRAENIAEHAYFMVEGVSLKHQQR